MALTPRRAEKELDLFIFLSQILSDVIHKFAEMIVFILLKKVYVVKGKQEQFEIHLGHFSLDQPDLVGVTVAAETHLKRIIIFIIFLANSEVKCYYLQGFFASRYIGKVYVDEAILVVIPLSNIARNILQETRLAHSRHAVYLHNPVLRQ